MGTNDYFWLTNAAGMDINGHDTMNGDNFTLFGGNGVCCVSARGEMKKQGYVKHSLFRVQRRRFCLAVEY